MQWFEITNLEDADTPALVFYRKRIAQNIQKILSAVKSPEQLRPHVKTNKTAEVCSMMMEAGINKFKCATIAEAEMLASIKAKDVLLAYQPVGPKAHRFLQLVLQHPDTLFSCVTDSLDAAGHLSTLFSNAGRSLNVFIDINAGMNRTGILPEESIAFFNSLRRLPSLEVLGVHMYDGHLVDPDARVRQAQSDECFSRIQDLLSLFEKEKQGGAIIVVGGSLSFAAHLKRRVECSPGTFVFWDYGYHSLMPEEPYEYAALVLARVISIVSGTRITVDLGYKAIAAENPLPRVSFLNAPDAKPVSHSEEHLSLEVSDSSLYKLGDIMYGVPVHICPTVALYSHALVAEDNRIRGSWKVAARDRVISI